MESRHAAVMLGRALMPGGETADSDRMWLDGLVLLILGLFVGMGAMRGTLASGLGILTLGVAYGSAIFAASTRGAWAAEATGAPAWLGMPIAGTLGFLGGFVLMSLVSWGLRRMEKRGRHGSRSPRDRFFGGVFGAVRGALVVLLLSYLALWAEALRTTGTVDSIPELSGSKAAAVTGSVVEAGVEAAMADSGSAGRVVARVASRPGQALAGFQGLMEEPAIAELQSDELFWTYVEHGSVDAALNRGSFLQVSYNSDLRARLGDLALIDAESVDDPQHFRAQAREVLAEVGPRIRGIKQDPEMQDLMADPEILSRVHAGDTLALLADARFQGVVARALEQIP